MKILFDEQEVQNGVTSLVQAIDAQWGWSSDLLVVTVLEGGRQLSNDVRKQIPGVQFSEIYASSYHGGTASSGTVDVMYQGTSFAGRLVVFLDDIYDTGNTMHCLKDFAYKHGARCVAGATLIDKKVEKTVPPSMQMLSSFLIPDLFVVGYGMDYEDQYRDLRHIAVL